ncbi:hypothetical protein MnTg02_01827 [bacterium MnTg02]|nr:hypothetical protein MnTg02_01827 [bacterium MnTg02]
MVPRLAARPDAARCDAGNDEIVANIKTTAGIAFAGIRIFAWNADLGIEIPAYECRIGKASSAARRLYRSDTFDAVILIEPTGSSKPDNDAFCPARRLFRLVDLQGNDAFDRPSQLQYSNIRVGKVVAIVQMDFLDIVNAATLKKDLVIVRIGRAVHIRRFNIIVKTMRRSQKCAAPDKCSRAPR